MSNTDQVFSIGAVERDTGIGRDTLRVWERRYGYPVPGRNDKGERVYNDQQIRHLQRIKRLMAYGYRPGKLLRMQDSELEQIERDGEEGVTGLEVSDVLRIIDAVRSTDAKHVWSVMQDNYEQHGMADFITELIMPLLRTVGELWAAGQLKIYQEHFLSQMIERFLAVQVAEMQVHAKKPRVLLATLPGEEHTMGLSMLAAILSSHEIDILNLGGSVPMEEISGAAEQFNVDVVGITFSSAYHYGSIRSDIEELRSRIDDSVDVWIGGEGTRRLRKLPEQVSRFNDLRALPI